MKDDSDYVKKLIKNKELDMIVIDNLTRFDNQFKRQIKNNNVVCIIPFLQDGIVICDNITTAKSITGVVPSTINANTKDAVSCQIITYFKTKVTGDMVTISMQYYYNNYFSFMYLFGCDFKKDIDTLLNAEYNNSTLYCDFEVDNLYVTDNIRIGSVKQITDQDECDDYINSVSPYIKTFFNVFGRINYLLSNPLEKEIKEDDDLTRKEKGTSNKSSSKTVPNPSSKSIEPIYNSVHTINLNGISMSVKDKNAIKRIKSKKRQNIATSWGVRGHIRHLKNGKTTYVRPYQKGTDKSKSVQKLYKI